MGRRRSAATRDLPRNLYVRKGYYSWRDPRDGAVHGLGYDKRDAIDQANEANLAIAGKLSEARLVHRLDSEGEDAGGTVNAWAQRYLAILDKRKPAKTTRDTYRRRLEQFGEKHGTALVATISTRQVAEFLAAWENHARMAQAVRSLLLDFFREAMAAGWIERNPVEPTRAPRHEVARARLTLADFRAIYAAAAEMPAWVQRSMELAITTGQRRSDLAALGVRNVREGKLWVAQQKTGAKVCIPLSLRLDALGWSLGEVIERCRDHVISPTFLHHVRHVGKAKPGDSIREATISAFFAEARDRSGITWPEDKTPPSFHEIRSLSARLYAAQGVDPQALLGHKSADMTAVYRDARGAEWIEVKTA
jgi:enterobacteria phage integrase